jgi:hypothetical protein
MKPEKKFDSVQHACCEIVLGQQICMCDNGQGQWVREVAQNTSVL